MARRRSAARSEIVAAGLSHTLDKALMLNFVEMKLSKASVSITARGLAANALKSDQHLSELGGLPHPPILLTRVHAGRPADRSTSAARVVDRMMPTRHREFGAGWR